MVLMHNSWPISRTQPMADDKLPGTTTRRRWNMSPRERWKLAEMMRHAANVLSLPAHPETWPDWMTPERRAAMVADFLEGAAFVEPRRPHHAG